jgi:hypothetical protein
MGGANGHEIVVGNSTQILRVKRHQRLRPAGCGDELDAHRVWPVLLDDRAKIALPEPVRRKVMREHDDIEKLHRHGLPPG